jgi:hypothetical protein
MTDGNTPEAPEPTSQPGGDEAPPPVPPLARVPHLTNLQSRSLPPLGTTSKPADLSNTIGLEDPKTPAPSRDTDSER